MTIHLLDQVHLSAQSQLCTSKVHRPISAAGSPPPQNMTRIDCSHVVGMAAASRYRPVEARPHSQADSAAAAPEAAQRVGERRVLRDRQAERVELGLRLRHRLAPETPRLVHFSTLQWSQSLSAMLTNFVPEVAAYCLHMELTDLPAPHDG